MEDGPDSLLKLGERWEFTYDKGKSKRLFGSFQQAVSRMYAYKLTQGLIDGRIDPDEDDIENTLLESIHITRTSRNPLERAIENEARLRELDAQRQRVKRRAKARLKELGIEPSAQIGGSSALLEQLLDAMDKGGNKNEGATKRVSKKGTAGKSGVSEKGTPTPKATKPASSKGRKR
jgi:hypothetical protein